MIKSIKLQPWSKFQKLNETNLQTYHMSKIFSSIYVNVWWDWLPKKIGSTSMKLKKIYIRIEESHYMHVSIYMRILPFFKYFRNFCKSYIIMTKKRIKANHITTCCYYYVMLSLFLIYIYCMTWCSSVHNLCLGYFFGLLWNTIHTSIQIIE